MKEIKEDTLLYEEPDGEMILMNLVYFVSLHDVGLGHTDTAQFHCVSVP